jgi:DNA topoisomerase IB
MPLLDYNAFGGMDGKNKQKVLREHRMAEYAKNTRLWDGSIRAYKTPKKVGVCTDNYVLDKNIKPVCTSCCASYFKSPCGEKCLYSLKDCKITKNGRAVG